MINLSCLFLLLSSFSGPKRFFFLFFFFAFWVVVVDIQNRLLRSIMLHAESLCDCYIFSTFSLKTYDLYEANIVTQLKYLVDLRVSLCV